MARDPEFKEYPKWVEHPTEVDFNTAKGEVKKRVLVNNSKEEEEVTGGKKTDKKKNDWKE